MSTLEAAANRAFWCDHAWLPGGPARSVRVELTGTGLIAAVTPSTQPRPGDHRLPGMVLPGFADAHSHAFHRALRGRTHSGGGSFWTWREAMYAVAQRLDPDLYLALARACYAELVLAGVTAVAEFHYLHHGPGGVPYAEPNLMAAVLAQAAQDAGLRLTLLDTCYLAGGLGPDGYLALDGVQRRFGDAGPQGWAARVQELAAAPPPDTVIGVAAHSVRAVPPEGLRQVAAVAARLRDGGRIVPVHAHLSEQPAENQACQATHGVTPAQLLDRHGLLGPSSTVVHATHLSAEDVLLLGRSGTTACFCPSTEQDLADGIGPARALRDAGAPIALGSDQHVAADLLGEARGLEMGERLASLGRGRFTPAELVTALTVAGHVSAGRPGGGQLAPGAPGDLVAVRLDSPRTAGVAPGQVVLVAGAGDVDTVVSAGRVVVQDGRHVLGDIGAALAAAIEPLWKDA